MSTIIRSVHNVLTHAITLEIPGYDANKAPVTVPASSTLDLFTVLNDEQLSSVQGQLSALVAAGDLTVADTADASTVELSGTAVRLAELNLTNVHADISTTAIFTPTVTGLYTVSFYGTVTTDGTNADAAPNLYIRWTDDGGAEAFFTFAGNMPLIHSAEAAQVTMPVYAIAGTPITFNTSAGNYTSTLVYSLRFVVQQL